MNHIKWLEKWYKQNCNKQWENLYGVEIGTLDNPGWYVNIDLAETKYEDLTMTKITNDHGEDDWMICEIVDHTFKGVGDCTKLEAILQIFRELIDGYNALNGLII